MTASTVPDICTCHSVREGHGGISFSMADLGVCCEYCDAREAEYAWERRIAEMTPEERRSHYLRAALYAAECKIRVLGIGVVDPNCPPF